MKCLEGLDFTSEEKIKESMTILKNFVDELDDETILRMIENNDPMLLLNPHLRKLIQDRYDQLTKPITEDP